MIKNIKQHWILILAFLWQAILYWRVDRFIWEDGLVDPWFITKGLMFDKDFYSTYTPLPKIVMIPINIVSGWSLATTPILGFFETLTVIFLIYYLAGKFLPSVYQKISVLFFSLFFTFILKLNTFDINLLLALLVLCQLIIFSMWLSKPKKIKIFFLGVVGISAVLSTDHTLIPFSIITLSAVIYTLIKNQNFISPLKEVFLPIIAGILTILLPILGWFAIRNALYDLYFWTIDYYLRPNAYPFSRLGINQGDLIMFIILNIPLLFYLFLIIIQFKKNSLLKKVLSFDQVSWFMIVLGIVSLVDSFYAIFAIIHPRRFLYLLPNLAVITAFDFYIVTRLKTNYLKAVLAFSCLIVVAYVFLTVIPWYAQTLSKGTKFDYYNLEHPGDPDYSAIQWLKNNSQPNNTLFLYSGNTHVYFSTNMLPTNNRSFPLPWVYEPFDQMKTFLDQKPADYWFVDERYFERFNQWGYTYQSTYLKSYLQKHYEKVAFFDYISIYKKVSSTFN